MTLMSIVVQSLSHLPLAPGFPGGS